MTNWIPVNAASLKTMNLLNAGPLDFSFGASLFDIPERVRGYLTPDGKTFVIEFGYMLTEGWKLQEDAGSFVGVRVGRSSGRLLGLEFDVPKVAEKMKQLVSAMRTRLHAYADKHADRRMNFDVASQVLETDGQRILQPLNRVAGFPP